MKEVFIKEIGARFSITDDFRTEQANSLVREVISSMELRNALMADPAEVLKSIKIEDFDNRIFKDLTHQELTKLMKREDLDVPDVFGGEEPEWFKDLPEEVKKKIEGAGGQVDVK